MTIELAMTRLGMLTPSSNTVLEPLTAAMLQELPDVSAHFARFRVVKISMEADALGQFTNAPMLEAADLLADAQVQSICWNGTSSGWLGFDTDLALIDDIQRRTGIPACSSVLALNELLERMGARRIALVTPYLPEVQTRIVENYACAGFEVVGERHLDDPGNYSFATYSEAQILEMCRAVATQAPDAIAVFCTNFRGAGVAETIEAETGITVLDSVSTALWKSMAVAGDDPRRIRGWGRLFDV
ncbi:maleate cis-trans isomerase family protein [Roseobacter sinensis]|uniref:Aspartate/glutamate racemase family protein n=1 Tax=Roseobacter sinensis TaxID=2931391 RepID=A0ABT3BIT9_9RHOB|nr:aspartate/glutamate racemase family protein [Roseobacter sp. WL0113]MCV3273455.1 aspartate/glutamate racemase family protein [Roseobacter sp. WL0113]